MNRYFGASVVGVAIAVASVACDPPSPGPAPGVTVQKLTVVLDDAGNTTESCWTTLSANDAGLPDPDFGPDPTCAPAPATSCPLLGGSDRLRVLVSYGDLSLSPGASPPAPRLTETLDGEDADAGASVSLVPADLFDHYIAAFTAPSRQVSEMTLAVDVVTGYGYQVPAVLAVDAPALSIDVSVCNSSDCAPPDDAGTAGVGTAEVVVGIPGSTPSPVTITTKIGGAVQPTTTMLQASTPRPFPVVDACLGAHDVPGFFGTVTIPTPIIDADEDWEVCAQWGGSETSCVSVVGDLAAPTPVLTVENCTAQCADCKVGCPPASCQMIFGGGTVVADVTFPGQTAMPATLTSIVDGVTQLPPVTLTFTEQSFDGQGGVQMSGKVPVPVPAAGTNWTLTAAIEDWTSNVVPITLAQPNVTAAPGSLTQPGCPAAPAGSPSQICMGLGSPTIPVQMTGLDSPQNVTLTWYQNQAPVTTPLLVALDMQSASCGPFSTTASIGVPTSPGGSYEIWSQFGSAVPQPLYGPVTVLPPQLTVDLNCGPVSVDGGPGGLTPGTPLGVGCAAESAAPCNVAVGSTVGVHVSAPPELSPSKVVLSLVSGGVPVTAACSGGSLALDPVTQMLEGNFACQLPLTGPWEIDAMVGSFTKSSCFTY